MTTKFSGGFIVEAASLPLAQIFAGAGQRQRYLFYGDVLQHLCQIFSGVGFGVVGLIFAGESGFMVFAPTGFFLGLGFCFFDWVSNQKTR